MLCHKPKGFLVNLNWSVLFLAARVSAFGLDDEEFESVSQVTGPVSSISMSVVCGGGQGRINLLYDTRVKPVLCTEILGFP